MESIFSSTGINNYYIMSFITYLVNVIFTVPGIMMIDVVGRRPLLFCGGVGMAVCNFIMPLLVSVLKMMKLMGFYVFHLHVFSLHFLLVLGVVRGPFVQISMVYLLDKRQLL